MNELLLYTIEIQRIFNIIVDKSECHCGEFTSYKAIKKFFDDNI